MGFVNVVEYSIKGFTFIILYRLKMEVILFAAHHS